MDYSKIHNLVEKNRKKLLAVARGESFTPFRAFTIAIEDHYLGLSVDDYFFDDNLEDYFISHVLKGDGDKYDYSPIMVEVLKKFYEVHHKEYYKHMKTYAYAVCDYIYENCGGYENSGYDTYDEWVWDLAYFMDETTNHLDYNWKAKDDPKPLELDLKLYDCWCDFDKKKKIKTKN